MSSEGDYLMLGVSDSDSCDTKYTLNDYGNISVDISHHIEIYFDDDTLSVNITGGGKDDYIRSWNKTHPRYDHIGEIVPVWFMSGKFGSAEYNRGNGTFSNIVITSSQFTNGTESPIADTTPYPTMIPTSDPTVNGTILTTGSPTFDPETTKTTELLTSVSSADTTEIIAESVDSANNDFQYFLNFVVVLLVNML